MRVGWINSHKNKAAQVDGEGCETQKTDPQPGLASYDLITHGLVGLQSFYDCITYGIMLLLLCVINILNIQAKYALNTSI